MPSRLRRGDAEDAAATSRAQLKRKDSQLGRAGGILGALFGAIAGGPAGAMKGKQIGEQAGSSVGGLGRGEGDAGGLLGLFSSFRGGGGGQGPAEDKPAPETGLDRVPDARARRPAHVEPQDDDEEGAFGSLGGLFN